MNLFTNNTKLPVWIKLGCLVTLSSLSSQHSNVLVGVRIGDVRPENGEHYRLKWYSTMQRTLLLEHKKNACTKKLKKKIINSIKSKKDHKTK